MSRWSGSTFVTTARSGRYSRNARSNSSASTTISSPSPGAAFVPKSRTSPPTRYVGERPARTSMEAISPVVVVLPWAPATQIA